MKQWIDEHTRITESSRTLIDLLFVSNEPKIVQSVVTHLSRSDHSVIYRVSKKKLMPFQIQISREFHYGTLSIPIGIQRTDRD